MKPAYPTPTLRRQAFTLIELLVVIAIIGILAGFLLPVLGRVRNEAKKALTATMLHNLEIAIADYHRDFGVYPPEKGASPNDKCTETLYYHLVGSDVDSPKTSARTKLRADRKYCKVYMDFKKEYVANYDNDTAWEAVDAWGLPWIYIRGQFPNKPSTSSGLGDPATRKPFHNRSKYDLYSVGSDGKTGADWKDSGKIYSADPSDGAGFYKQAGNEWADGMSTSGAKYSGDDIANF